MKHKNWSRGISFTLAGVMIIGCISFSTYAEEFINDIEDYADEIIQLNDTNEINIDEGEIFIEENKASEENSLVNDDTTAILDVEEVVTESSENETELTIKDEDLTITIEGEVNTSDVEAQMSELSDQQKGNETIIVLNYENYTLGMAGETVMLVATVDLKNENQDTAVEEAENMTEVEDFVEETELLVTESVEENIYQLSWSSSDETIAKVDDSGIVTAVASGEAIITCTLVSEENVTAMCTITVTGECTLKEHVHSREECFVRELICSHTSEQEHTDACFVNKFVCGMEEHVHDEDCFFIHSVSDDELAVVDTDDVEDILSEE